jgi:hypothetical protein
MPTSRFVRQSFTVLRIAAVPTTSVVSAAEATPPGIPSSTTAKSELATLTVAADRSLTGYSRDLFPHCISQGNNCDTREIVLKRDGTNAVTGSNCAATSGSWFSPYGGATWYAASDVGIDHVVPLADAWRTGAAKWTTAQRQAYANDLSDHQLIAVTDNVKAKGDKSPDQWKPPSVGYWCTYANMWLAVKYKFKPTVNSAEKTALSSMLGRC